MAYHLADGCDTAARAVGHFPRQVDSLESPFAVAKGIGGIIR